MKRFEPTSVASTSLLAPRSPYLHWTREFIRLHGRRHPRDLGVDEITAFLNDLAVRRHVAASTQNQARCALVFLYRKVLQVEMPALEGLDRARRPDHLPTRVREGLRVQRDAVAYRHRAALAAGRGEVDLPFALRAKMPGAATSLAWQYAFPAAPPVTRSATPSPRTSSKPEPTSEQFRHSLATTTCDPPWIYTTSSIAVLSVW